MMQSIPVFFEPVSVYDLSRPYDLSTIIRAPALWHGVGEIPAPESGAANPIMALSFAD